MTHEETIIEFWGERCPEYEPTCACCAAWRLFNQTGRAPSEDEVAKAVAQAWKRNL